MNFTANITENGDGVVAYVNSAGNPVILRQSDPGFAEALADLTAGREPRPLSETALSDEEVVQQVARVARSLSPRIDIDANGVTFDGDPVHGAWANAVVRYYDEGRPIDGLVRFYERLSNNPSEHSREQLWNWIEAQGLSVTPEGLILGYKALAHDGRSINGGSEPVFVNGVEHVGRIPQAAGDTVWMSRPLVDADYSRECAVGLHVGTYSYAKTFGPVLTEVSVDPADVVSVPQYDATKMRVAKYTILAIHLPEVDDLSQHEAEAVNDMINDEEFDGLFDEVPEGWLDKLFSKLTRARKGREVHTVTALVNLDAFKDLDLNREWSQADDEDTDPEYDDDDEYEYDAYPLSDPCWCDDPDCR